MADEITSTAGKGSTTPSGVADRGPRCWRCNRKLAVLVSRPWALICTRCKARNQSAT